MPTGVYRRTKEQLEAARQNLALGHGPAARRKARQALRTIAANPEWRMRVSEATRKAMHRPEVREKHLRALAKNPSYFSGGNGQPPTPMSQAMSRMLQPLGCIQEYIIRTKGHGTEHQPPRSYKADFAHPSLRIVIELDGASHRCRWQAEKDQKKTEVLEALGWKVIRFKH